MFDLVVSWFPYLAIGGWLALVAGGIYAVRRFLRAYERRSAAGQDLTALADRVRLLEDALERVEANVEQLAEAQQFTTRLLEERASSVPSGSLRR
jgi:hypothetical protein